MNSAQAEPRQGLAYAVYIALVLCLGQTMANVDRYLVAVAAEPLKHQMRLSDTQIGLLQGPSFVIFFALLSVPLGRLADVANRRWTIFCGVMVWTCSTIAGGLSRSFAELFASRLLVGLGEAALNPAAMSLLVAYFPRRLLNRGTAIISSGGSLGRSTAFLGGGALLTLFGATGGLSLFGARFVPWQGLFIVFGLLGLGVAALVLTIREPPRRRSEGAHHTFASAISYFWSRRAAFLPLFLSFSMAAIVVQALAAWSVSVFVRQHGLPTGQAAALLGICSLAVGPAGNVAGGWLTDALDNRGVKAPHLVMLTAILAVSVVFAAFFWLAGTLFLAAAAYVLLYFTCSMCGPPGYAGVQALAPDEHRGTTASLFLCTHMLLGAGLGPVIVGGLSDLGLPTLGAAIFAATVIAATVGVPLSLAGRKAFEACRQERMERAV